MGWNRWNLYNLLKGEKEPDDLQELEQIVITMDPNEVKEGVLEYLLSRRKQGEL